MFGAVWADNLHCDPLTPAYPLFILPHDRKTMLSIAQCFAALKFSINELNQYYSLGVCDKQPGKPQLQSLGDLTWKYIEASPHGKQVWIAEITSTKFYQKKVVVKFSELMNENSLEVLKKCSEAEIAPPLLASFISSRWTVTVMEHVNTITKNITKSMIETAETKLLQLHKMGYVHGDLRRPNILVQNDGNVFFIDFDYAGEVGKAVYPYFLNSDLAWPTGVEAGAPIMPEHDIYWLNNWKASEI